MFDPAVDCILPVDECWLVDPRVLAQRATEDEVPLVFDAAYAHAVDRLADLGYGCVPDPAAGDRTPAAFAATCIVYELEMDRPHRRTPDAARELHLRLLCTMARTDGAFVGSELAVALEVADRLGSHDQALQLRLRAVVRELFMNTTDQSDPLVQLTSMPRAEAIAIVDTLTAMAWADGYLRSTEQRMLQHVHQLLGLPLDQVNAHDPSRATTRYVDDAA